MKADFAAAFAALALALAACGQAPAPVGEAGDAADAADNADDSGASDAADDAPEDALTDAVVEIAEDVSADVQEIVDVPDVPVDVGECQVDADCAGKLTLTPCEIAACKVGTCVKAHKPESCCLDSDCVDADECSQDKCDQIQHTCSNPKIANCCSGKVLLQTAGFENGIDSFTFTNGSTNGNVSWQTSKQRAHGGKSSFYFGNACHTYDTSMTPAGACKPLPTDTKPVSTTLLSKNYFLPLQKKAQAHFWLWLDTEPSYAKTLQPGSCSPPCNAFSTCIQVAGNSVCEPEKDVLSLQVLSADAPPAPVFWSTQIGKTTLGDPANPSGWKHIAVDLAPWQGKNIQLAFQFNTLTNLKNAYEGIYLDDVVVETICANPGIVCNTTQLCDDDGLACTAESCTVYQNVAPAGVCFHDTIAACCLGDADCDDGNACTLDACGQNLCSHLPNAGKPGCCAPQSLQSDAFDDTALKDWAILDNNSTLVRWRLDPKGGNPNSNGNPSGALYFGNPSFTNYADPDIPGGEGPHGLACAKSVTLKSGTVYNLLKFDLMMDTEWSDINKALYVNPPVPGKPKFDYLQVLIASGGVYEQAWSSDNIAGTTVVQGQPGAQWLPVTVSLDAWAGKSVQICWRFDAGDNQLNDKVGVHVDNYSLGVACEKAACYWDKDCGDKVCGACEAPACSASKCGCAALKVCP